VVRVFLVLSGIMGAGGVALAAAAAHAKPGAGLEAAAQILLVHALAVFAGVALVVSGALRPSLAIVLAGWILGTLLFSGDVTLRAFAGSRLFPMAAPAGGIILMLSWLGLAAVALFAFLPDKLP
jgi:uncharacterized membrane protein YgdD (TMEM256/DUF423 family)